MEYLANYIVERQSLEKINSDVHNSIDKLLKGDNRLHCFMQLFEIAKASVEALEAVDKEQFLSKIKKELEEIRRRLDQQLADKATEVKAQYEEILQTAKGLERELQVRGACIESVAGGMNKTGEMKPLTDEVKEKMAVIERKLVEFQNIRQSAPFIDMCKLIDNGA